MNIHKQIAQLILYGINKNLIDEMDKPYAINKILNILNLDSYEEVAINENDEIDHLEVLDNIIKYASDNDIIESTDPSYSDLLDTAIMDSLMPRPSEVAKTFKSLYLKSPEESTDYFYNLSKDSHYIRVDRIKKNMVWQVTSEYGDVDITVNLSKPEKDPKAIEMALKQKQNNYPKCLLCLENVGYRGHLNHPARQSHRVIPLELNNENWYLQYSPYSYFNEHAIVFKKEHDPMIIGENTFKRLFDFVDIFPHYFIGSNADLPLVGGSMLSHDHYQCGRNVFPMERANVLGTYTIKGFEDVNVIHLNWPLSVIRLESENKESILDLSVKIYEDWKVYDNSNLSIMSSTGDVRHNTVTPIVRKHSSVYQIDIVLRNNRKSDEFPTGIFHPHFDVHAVKKENIGLIEVMGLAVLPSRLKDEMSEMTNAVIKRNDINGTELEKFNDIINKVKELTNGKDLIYENVFNLIKDEVGKTFVKGLTDSGVFKLNRDGTQGIEHFIKGLVK